MWTPPESQAAYYSIPSPSSTQSILSQLLPLKPSDPTYGRSALPRAPEEQEMRLNHKHRDGKVYLNGSKNEWVAYQVWEPKQGVQDRNTDLCFIHGINDFGGKFAVHAAKFLDEGYRIVVPDLPSHGRSTGIHVHCPSMEALVDAVYAVVKDVALQDSHLVREAGGAFTQARKTFIAGQSLGGFTAAYVCLKYGAPIDTDLPVTESFRPSIAGSMILCPMLAVSPETRPPFIVELVARLISSFASALPLAAANKGKNSEDPQVEQQFESDPQTYHGKLRVGTGLGILQGLIDVNEKMSHLKVPFLICHGTGDRVTSYQGSEKLFREASSTDKEIKLFPDYQHILLRKGRDEKDDERRQNVLNEMLNWMNRH
ncbi:uncharacterized protein JCM6883_007375 [Sporobolomyces salmoneus]|uniref:uncharacterized protein n=1 Tax=Sporobolomyces salmoneus TaxID=183962 RepID=UPI00316C0CAD